MNQQVDTILQDQENSSGGFFFFKPLNNLIVQTDGFMMDEQQPAENCWDQQIQKDRREEESSSCRIISPYPYPHASQEEIEERKHLSDCCSLSCLMQNDYGFFARMDYDDFSISSKEIHSLSEVDVCLHSMSDEPTFFWEQAEEIQTTTPPEERGSEIPREIRIVGSGDSKATSGTSSSSSIYSVLSELTIYNDE